MRRQLHADYSPVKHLTLKPLRMNQRPAKPDPADKLARAIKRPLKLLFFSPVIIACSLVICIVAGTMNLIFASLGRTFQDQYDFFHQRVRSHIPRRYHRLLDRSIRIWENK